MPYLDDEQDDQQDYQDAGGFRLAIPRRYANIPEVDPKAAALGSNGSDTSGQFPVKKNAEASQPQSDSMPRPSFGARIAGSVDDTPALNLPGPQDQKPLDQVGAGIRNQFPPPPPSAANTTGPLIQQRATAAAPIDPKAIDPATGKPKYRMGIGARIAGSVANFASGFNGRGPTSYVGPGATNRRFDVDKGRQAEEVGRLDTQIGQTEKLNDENRKLFESANKQAYDQQIGAARQETAGAQQETASARTALAAERERHNQAEENRKAQEDQNTPAPNQRPSLQKNPATGKVELMVKTKGGQLVPYTPKTVEEGALLGDPAAKAMFYYQHRKEGKTSAENNAELNGLSAAEQRDFKNRTKLSDKKIDSLMGARRDAVLFKQDTKDIDKQLADAQAERDQVRDDILSHRKGGNLKNEAAQRQSQNPQTGRKVGDVVTVKGQRVKVTKILPGGKYEGVAAD